MPRYVHVHGKGIVEVSSISENNEDTNTNPELETKIKELESKIKKLTKAPAEKEVKYIKVKIGTEEVKFNEKLILELIAENEKLSATTPEEEVIKIEAEQTEDEEETPEEE